MQALHCLMLGRYCGFPACLNLGSRRTLLYNDCRLCMTCIMKSKHALQNFDEVLVPADHVSRNPNDTYYIDSETVLRCHTSAHQAETLRKGERAFLVTGMPLALEEHFKVVLSLDIFCRTACTVLLGMGAHCP